MPVPSPDEKRGGKIQFILIWFLLGNAYLDLFIFFYESNLDFLNNIHFITLP
jgi:hypothetical protein